MIQSGKIMSIAAGQLLLSQAKSNFTKFEQGGGTDYIDEAIVLDRKRLQLYPSGHPERWDPLIQLATHLLCRFQKLGGVTCLQEVVVLGREALEFCPPGHPHRSISLQNLARYLWTQHKLGGMTDLTEAIVLGRESLDLRPPGHPDRSTSLDDVAIYLSDRYKRLGELSDLDEAIILGRQGLDLRPPGHTFRSTSLINVATCLSRRYEKLGEITDLDEAIALGRGALDLRPPGHPDRSVALDNIASYLASRYERLGEMPDLNETIVLARQALRLLPPGHPLRTVSLSNTASYLFFRFERLGAVMDLDEAIVLGRGALDLCPPGHPGRSTPLTNVAHYLCSRYTRLGELTDLDESITFGQEAVSLLPPRHPRRSFPLHNLANSHCTRYERFGEVTDLNMAIDLGREALNLRPPGHPLRSTSLNNVAYYLSYRFEQLGEMADLDEAMVLWREALNLHPSGHPLHSMYLENLAACFSTRFALSGQSNDKEYIFSLYSELAHVPHTVSLSDLRAARKWVDTAEDFRHPTTLIAYETSLRFLVHHLTALPSSPQHLPLLKKLASSLAVDAFSACLRNGDLAKAVELLEQGRGVFWNQLTRLRSPLEDVTASGPTGKKFADEFNRLTSLIQDAIQSPGADQHDQLCRLNFDLQNTVTDIRGLPGLSCFLLPSPFTDLRYAARDGPVIIVNASRYTCDALIVSIDRDPVHVPLEITKARVQDMLSRLQSLTVCAKRMDVRHDLGRLLRELWDEVVSPIIDSLQEIPITKPRIWWCPTAEFSLLPLHAAGPYRKGQRNLSHLYIISYTPTLTALIRARRTNYLSSPATNGMHFLAVGQATAAGGSELVSVGSELAIIGERIQGLATFTRIEGSDSCISRVSEELEKNEWVHLACHGLPNRTQPFESGFALHDGRFTIKRIMRCNLENAQFAYLSACHTTVGDEESPDEVIHLASAMQFAGFRCVIGTMWAVDDGQTNKITSMFYENMIDDSGHLDHTRAAFALNRTMNKAVNIPLDQRIVYVHIGA